MRRLLEVFFSLIPILIACAFGLWRLDAESVWHDEAWSIRAIDSPLGTPDDNTPPLYYVVQHGWQLLGVGDSIFALRYGSVLIFLLVVAMGYKVGKAWYTPLGGFLTATLLAISPLLWEFAQEVRAYIAIPFFALVLLYGVDGILNHRRGAWGIVLMAELAALYTHNLAVPLVVWVNTVLFATWGFLAIKGHTLALKDLRNWMMSQAALGLLYLPWILTQSPSGTTLNTVPEFGRELSQQIWRGYVFPKIVHSDDLPSIFVTYFHILPAIAAIAVLIWLIHHRTWRATLIFSQVLGLPILSTLLLQQASIDFHPRYYILAIPSTMLFLAMAIISLPRVSHVPLAMGVIGIVGFLTVENVSYLAEHPSYHSDDFAGLATHYSQLPNDAVILVPYSDEPTLTHVFQDQIQAEIVTLPLANSVNDAYTIIQSYMGRHVELLTWFQVPSDERGMYGCLLQSMSDAPNTIFETYGLQSVAYQLNETITEPITLDPQHLFDSVLSLKQAEYQQSDQGICVWGDWALSTPSTADYKMTALIQDPTETWILAQADGIIRQDDQRDLQTVAEQGAGFVFLSLPQGLSTADYPLSIRLYTPDNLEGVDVLNGNGQPIGKDMRFIASLVASPIVQAPDNLLQRDTTFDEEVYSGQTITVEILNLEPNVMVELLGDDWELSESISDAGLAWVPLQIPPDASGTATLQLGGEVLQTYSIISTDRIFTPPSVDVVVAQPFPPFAELLGFSVNQTNNQVQIDVVWHAIRQTNVDYTVFVQLLDINGQFLIGSDRQPDQGNRPTNSWIPNEYIMDSHILNLDTVNYEDAAFFLLGMYDPRSGERLAETDPIPLENGCCP